MFAIKVFLVLPDLNRLRTFCIGNEELLRKLEQDSKLNGNARAVEGLKEMETLFELLKAYGVMEKVENHYLNVLID
jgi:hypothetical protein